MSITDTRGAGPSDQRWCALCGAQHPAGVVDCAHCEVPLVDAPPMRPDEVGDEHGDQLAYELHDVDAAERLAIDRDLADAGIVHAWDGTTLIVAPYDEADVDAVLAGADPTGPDVGGAGGDDEQLVYDLSDWDAAQRAELAARLEAQGIGHAFDEHGDLVVFADDEDAVDAVLDEVEFPDQLEADHSAGSDGLDVVETLGALFVAADRLVHDPRSTEGVVGAADAARSLAGTAVPFGFEPATWEGLVAGAQALRSLLESDAEAIDDDAVVAEATRLRAALRPYV